MSTSVPSSSPSSSSADPLAVDAAGAEPPAAEPTAADTLSKLALAWGVSVLWCLAAAFPVVFVFYAVFVRGMGAGGAIGRLFAAIACLYAAPVALVLALHPTPRAWLVSRHDTIEGLGSFLIA